MLKKSEIIKQIKPFLDGSNNDLKYLVNVETDSNTIVANCIIHEPNQPPRIELYSYTPYMYVKDLKKYNKILFNGDINISIFTDKNGKRNMYMHLICLPQQKGEGDQD